ncbi:DUF4281 domain-containing protein [Amycolatopsis rhizosphaerae]|uniref:DUF4281 domain-containing protein n=1 Tax=Amycolatopsis rhizosphaerae TaxID=2053003 RepID=A0A558APV0_9PSEU|nr:ABA4-like family protein [Amycolatopsis rhizosphaerae]TVT26283.1 DUF4281 domain-containing protein [Amycolatopsis rhizosphaerae]
MNQLFQLTFWLAAPFWALMILAPSWRWTSRILASPWVTLLPLAVYALVVGPHFGALWTAVSRPDLPVLQAFLAQPYGAAAIWAHLVAFDLFLGRWMYFEARARGIHPLVVGPILLLTIFLSPIGVVVFLAVRSATAPKRAANLRP